MTWFKVDDGFHSHAKVVSIPRAVRAEAIGTWTVCGSWSADHEKDGFVPDYMVDQLGGTDAGAEALVAAGLWRRRRHGFVFVNWAEHQPTRAELEAKRAGNRRRQAAFRARAQHGAVTLDFDDPNLEISDTNSETPPRANDGAAPSRVTDALVRRSRPVPRTEVSQVPASSSDGKRDRSDDRDPVVASVIDTVAAVCRRDLHPLVVWDVVAFLDDRRGPRAKPLQNPPRYYRRAIEGSPAEVQQFIDTKGLAS